jgi:hypothetical protein
MESPEYRRDGFVISTDFATLAAPEMWMERVPEKK